MSCARAQHAGAHHTAQDGLRLEWTWLYRVGVEMPV